MWLRRAALGAGVLCTLAGAVAQAVPYPLPQTAELQTVTQLDEALDRLRMVCWTLHGAPFAPDGRGRTIAQDVNEWLLTPAHQARLEALRDKARSEAANPAQEQATLAEAAQRLYQESVLATVLTAYWGYAEKLTRHQAALESLTQRVAHDDGAARARRIAPLAEELAGALRAAMSADSLAADQGAVGRLTDATQALFDAYNHERGELAAALSEQERAAGKVPLAHERDTPCGAGTSVTSGNPKPKLGPGNSAPEAFYPLASKRNWFEGRIVVQAFVSASGCLQKAAVWTSSGADELDEGALRWALQAVYLPAEVEHHAADGEMLFALKFKLDRSWSGSSP